MEQENVKLFLLVDIDGRGVDEFLEILETTLRLLGLTLLCCRWL